MLTPLPRFRRARPEEAEAITRLALRSKRHWGYDDAFMAALTPELTFTPADLAQERDHVEVLESSDDLLGVFRLCWRTEMAFLEDLWIDPEAMGRGYGRLAFERTYLFDYTLDGNTRRQGFVVMFGQRVETIGLE